MPNNPDFWAKLAIALALVGLAVFLQASTGAIPGWLSVLIVALVNFFIGVSTTPRNGPPANSGGS